MILGCYGYETEIAQVIVHVFINDAVRCTCRARELKISNGR